MFSKIKLYGTFTYKKKVYNRFPTLNEQINIERSNKFAAATIKKVVTNTVRLQTIGKTKIDYPVIFTLYIHSTTRHDLDNLGFCTKSIFDGMQKSGMLLNDNQAFVKGYSVYLVKDKEDYVEVLWQKVSED